MSFFHDAAETLLPLSLAWRQGIIGLLMLIATTAPVAWVARSDAAVAGAIIGLTSVSTLFVIWLLIPSPRPEMNYPLPNAVADFVYITIASVSCYLWNQIFLRMKRSNS